MYKVKVSIIIPIYNIQTYLTSSVESSLSQTEPEIEIILVDDGSTDGSGALCDEYARRDDRVKVIHKENGGLSSARNAGIAVAAGEYALLLDGDDYLHPEAVRRLLAVMEESPSDIVQFHYIEVEQVVPLPELGEQQVEAQAHTPGEAFDRLYRFGGVYASGCTKLFRTTLLREIPFEPIRHEDEMWCTRAFPRGLTITYVPDVLYGYVNRPGSIIRGKFNPSRLDSLKVQEARQEALAQLGLSDLETGEWNRMFSTLFTLYRDAKMARDREAQRTILTYFQTSPVLERVRISGRMKIFYGISRLSRKVALDLYYAYWKVRG